MQARDGDAPSWYNAVEAGVVADLVSGLLEQGQLGDAAGSNTQADIGVIATYRRQVRFRCLALLECSHTAVSGLFA